MMSPNRIVTVMLALALSLFTMSASAQTTTTGSIEGTVVDVNGAAVPGVTVTVSGQNLIRAQSATTNDEGIYRIPNIPPGRYAVTVEAARGFSRYEQTNVEVNLSRTSTVAVTLQPQGASEVVEVTASSGAAVDTSSTTTGTNVSTEQFSNFPTQRTVQSLYTIAPTVARSGLRDASGRDRDPSVGGSSGPENNYILDGVTVTDPAFGGSGANLPFEFVQEVEIKTGAISAEFGKATGGIFNVVTKSGSNDFRGDIFGYVTTQGMVREVKSTAIPRTGSAPNGFSEVDAGFDIGGPIVRDKLWFFGAFNPQRRENFFLTQTFLNEVQNKITTPFYAGKITWGINQNHIFNFSTFGDFTRQEGFLFGQHGFGARENAFRGVTETGGSNYAFRLNSTFTPNWIGEFSGGLHFQRANTLPEDTQSNLVTDRFAVVRNGAVVTPVESNVNVASGAGQLQLAFVNGTGGTLQRNFVRQGFGLQSEQDRDRYEFAARLQNLWGKHTFKYGFEWNSNRYVIETASTGPEFTFTGALAASLPPLRTRVENRFAVCRTEGSTLICPDATRVARAQALLTGGALAGQGITSVTQGTVNLANIVNPFLLLDVVRVRDFRLSTGGGDTQTNTQSFYFQDDWKLTRNLQLNLGLRWDFQQAKSINGIDYFNLNDFKSNTQPRLGFIWDFTGEGRSKVFASYARYIETPIPLDINVRASGNDIQTDWNLNVSRLNAPSGSAVLTNFGNLGNHPTPTDPGIKPQSVNEFTAGIEYEVVRDLTFGFRGIYRAQDEVIEDGSFDDGDHYFLFNPGRRGGGDTTEDIACSTPGIGCFGPARRYYRAVEFTATKRFTNNFQFISSYVYSSLIGNYEGLFRNDNGQSDPNITSLFDLVSLLSGTYGRLPNDRPHQFKFDGSYRTPINLMVSTSFRAQSGIPFNALIPHPLYGDNEGFCGTLTGVGFVCNPRGTAINPLTGRNRTPTTYNLDLGLYYPIQFGENRQLRLQLDWFNVTNAQRAIRQDETFYINSGTPGVAPVPNPFFGNGTIFQFPSALRLGAKFSF
jgi:outer membrane receptor protein involved in Fe transport